MINYVGGKILLALINLTFLKAYFAAFMNSSIGHFITGVSIIFIVVFGSYFMWTDSVAKNGVLFRIWRSVSRTYDKFAEFYTRKRNDNTSKIEKNLSNYTNNSSKFIGLAGYVSISCGIIAVILMPLIFAILGIILAYPGLRTEEYASRSRLGIKLSIIGGIVGTLLALAFVMLID